MPIPANWLEELVIEWLDLDGFVVSTNVSVPAKPGGKFAPDAVGARVDENGKLVIRHCEAGMFLIDAPKKVAGRYAKKFSPDIQKKVRDHFKNIFGDKRSDNAVYEKWIITLQASQKTKDELKDAIKDVKICMLNDFVLGDVLATIQRWNKQFRTESTAMPADKWLLHLLDGFRRAHLLADKSHE